MSRETWSDLTRLEPDLGVLRAEVRLLDSDRRRPFCAIAAWYGYNGQPGVKARVSQLVGWNNPQQSDPLRTSEAYDLVYFTLLSELPPCRGRSCDCEPGYIQRHGIQMLRRTA